MAGLGRQTRIRKLRYHSLSNKQVCGDQKDAMNVDSNRECMQIINSPPSGRSRPTEPRASHDRQQTAHFCLLHSIISISGKDAPALASSSLRLTAQS